jgi:hypothetical protein
MSVGVVSLLGLGRVEGGQKKKKCRVEVPNLDAAFL